MQVPYKYSQMTWSSNCLLGGTDKSVNMTLATRAIDKKRVFYLLKLETYSANDTQVQAKMSCAVDSTPNRFEYEQVFFA